MWLGKRPKAEELDSPALAAHSSILLVIRYDRKAKLLTVKIIEETEKMGILGCRRSLLCELCVSFLEKNV